MIHEKHRYHIVEISTAEELAKKLTQYTWTRCSGFLHDGILFLNDSFSEDGAQEYAVFIKERNDRWIQVESITFSWCSEKRALELIGEVKQGLFGCHISYENLRLEDKNHHCHLCA